MAKKYCTTSSNRVKVEYLRCFGAFYLEVASFSMALRSSRSVKPEAIATTMTNELLNSGKLITEPRNDMMGNGDKADQVTFPKQHRGLFCRCGKCPRSLPRLGRRKTVTSADTTLRRQTASLDSVWLIVRISHSTRGEW